MTRPRPGLVLQLFVRASRVQKRRAVLTIAAIAWGSLALLLLLAFGEGLKRQIAKGGEGLGSNLAIIFPGETSRVYQGLRAGRPIRPRIDDIDLIRERVEGLDGVAGEMRTYGANFTHGPVTINGRLTGAHAAYGELRNQVPRPGGRFLNERDIAQRRRTIFLGNAVAERIFGDDEAVGQVLLVNAMPYTVVGVMQRKIQMGTYGGPDEDNALIPITTFEAQFGRDRLTNLIIKPHDPNQMKRALRRVNDILGSKYGYDPDDERAMFVWDTVENSKLRDNIMIGIEIFLGIIGALTLMIGGVGVANIMYAVVKERSREIGVMMALGARRAWVVGPIVLEALSYTLTGGLIGVLAALGIVSLLGLLPTEGNEAIEFLGKPTLSLPIGIVAAAVLGLVGLAAGYFPARRAASIQPAEVLRDE